jgi:hypothetical protein
MGGYETPKNDIGNGDIFTKLKKLLQVYQHIIK